jgi:hypothetical protein|tara:strand:- start:240 stop:893 length:654 start_codon:yes stop_codon:yes gene_type:complete
MVDRTERLFPKSISEVKELEKYYKKDITELIDDLSMWTSHKSFRHSTCWVIGNGTSRKGIDLEKLTRYYKKSKQRTNSFVIGCNYLYKEFVPDVLIAQDTKVLLQMVKDDIDIPVVAPLLKYNWARHNGQRNLRKFFCLRYPTYNMTRWNSGDIGIYVAALLGFNQIKLIGFDGGKSSMYREDDGVSFVKSKVTNHRIQIIKNSFDNVTINRYEDNL